MLFDIKAGQLVIIKYRKSNRKMPYYNKKGIVLIVGNGRPRNHLILTQEDVRVIVPHGNLFQLTETHKMNSIF